MEGAVKATILASLTLLISLPVFSQTAVAPDSEATRKTRERMVSEQIRGRGISAPEVIEAMLTVPRHQFVPRDLNGSAYADHPLPIGEGQTISQPYIVALMTEVLRLKAGDKVLEIGTGSGYQAAILAAITSQVYTIEIKPQLYLNASNLLKELDYQKINCRQGDGYFGWEEAAPFDAILITAAVDHIPPPLVKQLKDGGRLVLPLGSPFGYQNLVLVTKNGEDVSVKQIIGVLFVPMTGHAMSRTKP
jgi:protein-L-isoaspartate(D-aspartate) O-methyltransferase